MTVVRKNWEPLLEEWDVSFVREIEVDGSKAVRVGAGVGHGENTGTGVLQLEVLVGELLAVDGLAASAIVVGEVTTLEHELGDDTVESGAGVAEALLASAESTEVLSSARDVVTEELHDDTASGLWDMISGCRQFTTNDDSHTAANGDIEVNVGGSHFLG